MTKITHILAVAVVLLGAACGVKASMHYVANSPTAPCCDPSPCPGPNCPLLK